MRVWCDGEDTHPKVYLQIDEKLGYVICPYCIKRYDATWKPPENTSDKSSLRE
jgi:uncharacterized Zn-finger protein